MKNEGEGENPGPEGLEEVKVRFDSEELERFFEGFVPLGSPLDALFAPILSLGASASEASGF